MKKLSRSAHARSRAEQIAQDACRYVRNEGRERVRGGDRKHVTDMMASIRIISGLNPKIRDRLLAEIREQIVSAIAGERDAALVVPIKAKPPYAPLRGAGVPRRT